MKFNLKKLRKVQMHIECMKYVFSYEIYPTMIRIPEAAVRKNNKKTKLECK
jgi:hypothetical protein